MKLRPFYPIVISVFVALGASAQGSSIQSAVLDGTGDGAGPGAPRFLYACSDSSKNVSVVIGRDDNQNLTLSESTEIPLTFFSEENVSRIPGQMPGEPIRYRGERFELAIALGAPGNGSGQPFAEAELTDSLRENLGYEAKTLVLKCVEELDQ